MVPEALHVVLRFGAHALHELVVRRVHAARKLEVLPDEDAELYATVVRIDRTRSVGVRAPSQMS